MSRSEPGTSTTSPYCLSPLVLLIWSHKLLRLSILTSI
jgi:hypothetical protein